MKVAVIGAGAAGLCCARHLSRYPELFQFKVLEKMKEVGGTWLYSPCPTTASGGETHSSMYKNLRVNIPKEIMIFPDFPFPSDLPSFVHHSKVLEYLHSYASHYKLYPFIRFGMLVDQVEPVTTTKASVNMEDQSNCRGFEDSVKWRVTTQDVETGVKTCEIYDAVLVCNGHFSVPAMPAITGLSLFPGQVIHSHVYREPEAYKDQNVLVVGTGQSGRDLILDISTCARQVYLSNRGPRLTCSIPDNVEEMFGIAEVGADGMVVFTDGEKRIVDSIVLATGYKYSFPFLSKEAGVAVKDGKRVTPLYKHIFSPMHPSLAFMGANFGYNPFPYFDQETRWILSVWTGKKSLPSVEEMLKDEEDWYQSRLRSGIPPHNAGHYLGSAQWNMIYLLAELAGNEPQVPVMESLYEEVSRERADNLMRYKDNDYMILDKERWARTS